MSAGQVAMLLVLAVIAISLGVAANREWKRANRAEAEADEHAARLVIAELAWERAEREVIDAENALCVEQEDHERTRRAWHEEREQANVLPVYAPVTDVHLAEVYTLGGGA